MFASLDLSKKLRSIALEIVCKTGSYSINYRSTWCSQKQNKPVCWKTYVELPYEDGMPWYAATTSVPYHMGDKTLDDVKTNRDDHLQLFVFSEAISCLFIHSKQQVQFNISYRTQYQTVRKCKTAPAIVFVNMPASTLHRMYGVKLNQLPGCIIFRGVEAYLNYMGNLLFEKGRIDGKAANYWRAVPWTCRCGSWFQQDHCCNRYEQRKQLG